MNAAALVAYSRRRLERALAETPDEPTNGAGQATNQPSRLCVDCRERQVDKHRRLGVCHRCFLRRVRGTPPERQRNHTGPCRSGCGRRGRGASGLCKVCYGRAWHRRWRWQGMFRRLLGTTLTLDRAADALRSCQPNGDADGAEALRIMRLLLWEMRQGNLYLARPGRRNG